MDATETFWETHIDKQSEPAGPSGTSSSMSKAVKELLARYFTSQRIPTLPLAPRRNDIFRSFSSVSVMTEPGFPRIMSKI